jgi:diguanylate cyclase (GGDEF)-like protein
MTGGGSVSSADPVIAAISSADLDLSAVIEVIEAAPVGMVVIDGDQLVYVSRRAAELTGLDPREALEPGFLDMLHPYDSAGYAEVLAAVRDRRAHQAHLRTSPARGSRTLQVRVFPVFDRVVVSVSDATAEAANLRELHRFRAVADATSDLVGMATPTGELLYVNPAARRFHGVDLDLPADEIVPFFGMSQEDVHRLMSEGVPVLSRGDVWECEVDVESALTGLRVPFWAVWVPIRNERGTIDVIASTFRDVSERRRFEHRLAYAAAHDPLTGLPNRERLFEVLADRSAARVPVAVLFCDLDDFKVVNDTLGHAVGDRVLRTIADRLLAVSRSNDVVGRLGGDEFLVVCGGVQSELEACEIAERISEAIHEPIVLSGREYRMSASIGISMRDGEKATRAGDLVLEADLAMYRAKQAGRRHIELFDSVMRTEMVERLDLERDLRLAIERDEIEVFFQPIVGLGAEKIDAFESLVRWRHPDRGLLPPSVFLELSETAGLGVQLGDVVIEQACRAAAAFIEIDPTIQVGFNVSTSQMRAPDLAHRVARAARTAGVPTDRLVLEVTEDIVMSDTEGARSLLQQLQAMGMRIAVDDFGTGYSSLAMLRRLPVDVLKIDRSFVDGLGVEPGDTQIVRLIVSLAEELGLSIVGEGVETEAQSTELSRLGCDLVQGYLYAPPVPFADALDMVRTGMTGTPRRHDLSS